ncbi:hypothetical protein [Acinetobacter puyangensis]|uniref:hypothetical protein n=1 Tax=Acinetobacter puyangensis TaxID=1096779 RepID=UPI003A4D356D
MNLRIHRALSWLEQAEKNQDLDSKFIFYWIAFNAIYAQDFENGIRGADKGLFTQFIHELCTLDQDKKIYQLVWKTYSGSIRILLDNKFTFQPFWDYHNGLISEEGWSTQFEANKKRSLKALSDQNTPVIVTTVFHHIYTLRNQIVHGGATYNSTVNRDQVRDACNILASILPAIILIML